MAELNPTKEYCLASDRGSQSCPHKCYLYDKYERWLCEGRDVNNYSNDSLDPKAPRYY
jgi:hypothetical protein